MATNKEIVAHVRANYGFVPQDCWIAHARMVIRSRNGKIDDTVDIGTPSKPCVEQKRIALFAAMKALGDGK